ncbi:MAG: dihydroorotate dehydrogenase (quinone) [Hyphomicrobiales bacterium]|nr:MAG: dihydroorotate dehydrogenase (quinone) [Hyphomicrobiales bacterium]
MGVCYESLALPALFAIDPERAHGLSIAALRAGIHPRTNGDQYSNLKVKLAGLNFPNPIGMAAGYDKNGEVPNALLALGFGHAEIGTVTPKPQKGNPRPRIFRLRRDRAVINRFGFNSDGHQQVKRNLPDKHTRRGIIGVNLGANKTSEDFAADYVTGIHAFGALADYFTVNISSPNTPGLRALQGEDFLPSLLKRVVEARDQVAETQGLIPVFLKISPDLTEVEMDTVSKAVTNSDINALIVSNTTISRSGLQDRQHANETGGLSGRPLYERSTIVLAKMYQRLGKQIPLIGVGGIEDADTAFAKLQAGASLVQFYSAMVYKGPALPGQILAGIARKMAKDDISEPGQITGRAADEWAAKPL